MPDDAGGTMISAAAAADPPDYDRARAVARFDGVMRELVNDLKFRDRHQAGRLLGRWLAQAGAELLIDADVIVPVPLPRGRLIRRRFNQSAILGLEVARLARVGYAPLALVRTRKTPTTGGSHTHPARPKRCRSIRGSANERLMADIAGAKVVLVDDVITTGATVLAPARAP